LQREGRAGLRRAAVILVRVQERVPRIMSALIDWLSTLKPQRNEPPKNYVNGWYTCLDPSCGKIIRTDDTDYCSKDCNERHYYGMQW
jgi:hypothetical protein